MAKVTKATLTKKIQERTGLSRRRAQQGIKEVLESMKVALQMGEEVDFDKLGRLVVVERERKRVVRKNLKGRYPCSIVELHKKHPRSVRLLGGKDLSEDPKPTIVHKNPEPERIPVRRFAIAIPRFRGRPAR